MTLSDERKFATFRRGKVRDDIILARFRNTLRGLINPDTKQLFTEDEIAIITQEDSRFFIEADAIDLFGQAIQQRAIWFADQVRPERAASGFLRNFHGALWLPDGLLDATGGSGAVSATGSAGTIYVGSTTLGDPAANVARDPSNKRYQVLVTTTADSNGDATLAMQAIDPGDSTNLLAGTVLTWVTPPLGTDSEASVQQTFSGGFNQETENEFAQRIVRRIRSKPGSGNAAQFRYWATEASNAIADAFVYPTALHAGSVIVAISQKRGSAVGPLARIASIGTLASTTAYLAPPTSTVVPHGVHVLVVPMVSEPANMALQLTMLRGSAAGWADPEPWPVYSSGYPSGVVLTNVTSQQYFTFQTDQILPDLAVGGFLYDADVPSMMIWDDDLSRFELLDIASIQRVGVNTYDLALNNAPNKTVVVGDVISPANNRATVIAESFEAYFDELGPGELVPTDDSRYISAARKPRPEQEYPMRAGQSIVSRLNDQLGGALSDAELVYIDPNTPTTPAEYDIVDGPNVLTLGKVGIYSAL